MLFGMYEKNPPASERNFNGAGNQNRTGDLILTMDALYLLSYAGLILVAGAGFDPTTFGL